MKVTDKSITLSKGSNLLMGTLIGSQGEKQKLYIGYDTETDMTKAKRAINSPLNGDPSKVPYLVERTINIVKSQQEFMSVDLGLDAQDVSAIDTMIRGNKQKFVDMTDPKKTTVATKEKYNKLFGEFAEATRGNDDAVLKQTIVALNGYLKIFDATFDTLWAKEQNKRYIANVLLETGSTSAKVNAIAEGKAVGGVNSIGQMLAKRQGHVDAFKNSGITITEKSFANLYEKAKKIDGKTEKYETETVPQAIALVSYYRRGLKPTTGFVSGDLEIIKGQDYRETATEMDAKAKLEESFQTTREFTLLLGKVNTFMKSKKADVAPLSTDQLMDLVKNQTLETSDGVTLTLPSEFVKMLFAPCANEGFMISFGQLSMKYSETTTKVEKTPGDVYVGMEYTENYQTANSINIGAGALAGRKPKAPKPPVTPPPVEPPVEPPKPDGGTVIEVGGDDGVIIGGTNGTGIGGDDGEGEGGR